jgi:iron-sulfur cluster insertion protein
MNLTIDSLAEARISSTLAEEGNADLKLRIYIANRAPEGTRFGFVFDKNHTSEDTVVTQGGYSVIVENSAAMLMSNATLTHNGSTYVVNLN